MYWNNGLILPATTRLAKTDYSVRDSKFTFGSRTRLTPIDIDESEIGRS